MALRAGHGAGGGQPRIEVLPPDELPAPVPSPELGSAPVEQPKPASSPPVHANLREARSYGGKRSGEVRRARRAAIAAAAIEQAAQEARRAQLAQALAAEGKPA